MSKDLAKKTNSDVAVHAPSATQTVLSSDIVIPRVLLMQGLSDLVSEGKAKVGDIVKSPSAEKLGDKATVVKFIPLKLTNEWALSERVGNKFEFRKTEPRTPLNEKDPWDYKVGGVEWKRTQVINVYALLPKDVDGYMGEMTKLAAGDVPDLKKSVMPVLISFRSTSFKAGKEVSTFFAKLKDMEQRINRPLPSYNYTLDLGCYADKNDKGNYFVYTVGDTEKVDPKYLEEAARWYHTLNAMAVEDLSRSVEPDERVTEETPKPAHSHKGSDLF